MKKFALLLLLLPICFASPASMPVIGVQEIESGFKGLVATLELNAVNGSGKVYFNTLPLAETDTQASARLAIDVACQALEADCSVKDFLFSINTNSPSIGGPSAGSAMAILAMAELSGENLRQDLAITGTINPDKSIGVVGGVAEKAQASQEAGFKAVLIPKGTRYLLQNSSLTIEVIEVSTIYEAFYYFTGKSLGEQSANFSKEGFDSFMKIMSENLINESKIFMDEMIEKIDSSNISGSDLESLQSLKEGIMNNSLRMDELYNSGNYYSASSYSVMVGINSLYTSYVIDYLLNESNISEMISGMGGLIDDFEDELNGEIIIDNINDFEAISISIERLFEAKDLLNSSIESYNNNDSYGALYNLAYSKIRLNTAKSWFSLNGLLKGNLSYVFNQEDYSELAYTRIENAKTLLNYANSLGESYYSEYAQELIDSSMSAYNKGDIIYSLFQSLKSISNSNLALSLSGVNDKNLDERILLLKDLAAKNINYAQSKDVLPILAHSYYEYGQIFMESEPFQSIIFFEYSKHFSMLSEQLAYSALPINAQNPEKIIDKYFLPKLAVSLFVGLAFSLLILEVYYERALANKRRR